MLELWNRWYDILVSVEALAAVIVVALLGSCVTAFWQSRRP